jgi:hypothetical protein
MAIASLMLFKINSIQGKGVLKNDIKLVPSAKSRAPTFRFSIAQTFLTTQPNLQYQLLSVVIIYSVFQG